MSRWEASDEEIGFTLFEKATGRDEWEVLRVDCSQGTDGCCQLNELTDFEQDTPRLGKAPKKYLKAAVDWVKGVTGRAGLFATIDEEECPGWCEIVEQAGMQLLHSYKGVNTAGQVRVYYMAPRPKREGKRR